MVRDLSTKKAGKKQRQRENARTANTNRSQHDWICIAPCLKPPPFLLPIPWIRACADIITGATRSIKSVYRNISLMNIFEIANKNWASGRPWCRLAGADFHQPSQRSSGGISTGSSAAVSRPLRPIASAENAPACSPIWKARAVPMPCEATPIANP